MTHQPLEPMPSRSPADPRSPGGGVGGTQAGGAAPRACPDLDAALYRAWIEGRLEPLPPALRARVLAQGQAFPRPGPRG